MIEEFTKVIGRSWLAVPLFIYTLYCWIRQGTHVRGKGWKTKEEMPKTFYFSVGLYLILGISIFAANFLMIKTK